MRSLTRQIPNMYSIHDIPSIQYLHRFDFALTICSFHAGIFLVPSLILCLVTFDCEYIFFRALLKGLFETMPLDKTVFLESTNNLGTFKMNYWVLGLRKTMTVGETIWDSLVLRRLLSVLSPRMRPRFCVLFLCLAVFVHRLKVVGFGYGQEEVNPCLHALSH